MGNTPVLVDEEDGCLSSSSFSSFSFLSKSSRERHRLKTACNLAFLRGGAAYTGGPSCFLFFFSSPSLFFFSCVLSFCPFCPPSIGTIATALTAVDACRVQVLISLLLLFAVYIHIFFLSVRYSFAYSVSSQGLRSAYSSRGVSEASRCNRCGGSQASCVEVSPRRGKAVRTERKKKRKEARESRVSRRYVWRFPFFAPVMCLRIHGISVHRRQRPEFAFRSPPLLLSRRGTPPSCTRGLA